MDLAEIFRHDPDYLIVPAGENIFREGAPADSMYVLIEGAAEIVLGGGVVEQAGPGALIGEMALIDEGTRAATVRALTPCKLVPIDRERFHLLIVQTPSFATHVMKIMCERLRRMDRLVAARPPAGSG